MPIYDKHKMIFIHVPKCAGTSINNYYCPKLQSSYSNPKDFSLKYMFGRELQHITARKMSILAPVRFRKYFKFAFVRNPYSRIESEYNWRKSWDSLTQKMSLSDFIDTIPERQGDAHFLPASKFLISSKGKLLVDFVGKFESMEEELIKIDSLAGIDIERGIGKANVSRNSSTMTEKDKKEIYRIYQKDFENFNYEK